MRGLDVNVSDRAVVNLLRLVSVIGHASEQALRSDAITRVAGAYMHVVPSAREARRPSAARAERARRPGASRESKQRARDVLIAKLEATRAKMHSLSGGGGAAGAGDRLSPTDSLASSRSGGRSLGSGGGRRSPTDGELDDARSVASGRSLRSARSARSGTKERRRRARTREADLYSFATASSESEEDSGLPESSGELSGRFSGGGRGRGRSSRSSSASPGLEQLRNGGGSGSGTPIDDGQDDFLEETMFFDCSDDSSDDSLSEGDGELLDTQEHIMGDLDQRISFVQGELRAVALDVFPAAAPNAVALVDLAQLLEEELARVQRSPASSMAWTDTATKVRCSFLLFTSLILLFAHTLFCSLSSFVCSTRRSSTACGRSSASWSASCGSTTTCGACTARSRSAPTSSARGATSCPRARAPP